MKKNPQNPVPGPIESGLPAAICRRTGIKSQIYGQIYDTSVLDSLLEKVFKTAFGLPPLLHYRLLLRKEECSNTNTKNTNTKTTTGGPCFCLHYNDAAVSEGGVLNLGIKEKCPGKGASSQPTQPLEYNNSTTPFVKLRIQIQIQIRMFDTIHHLPNPPLPTVKFLVESP